MSLVRRSFGLPVELAARLKARAEETGMPQRQIVERALRHELCPQDYYSHACDFQSSVKLVESGPLRQTACNVALGGHTQAEYAKALSAGLFRRTGPSDESR